MREREREREKEREREGERERERDFICTQLNAFLYCYLAGVIQFNIIQLVVKFSFKTFVIQQKKKFF